MWTSDRGVQYRALPLRSKAADSSRLVGLAVLATRAERELPSSYWAVCDAVVANLVQRARLDVSV